MLYVIIILIALVLFLSAKLLLVKSQMKKVIGEMRNNPDKRQMNVDFVDGDLQDMIVEVNRLYEDIMQIKADGKEEERKMKESISMISHDMRTPLTSIIGYLQIAEKTEDRVEMTSNIEISLERARYLNKLVNDFFELSLIESDQVDIKTFTVTEVKRPLRYDRFVFIINTVGVCFSRCIVNEQLKVGLLKKGAQGHREPPCGSS